MFTAHITMTGKSYSPKASFTCFGEDKITAVSLKELKHKLSERYGSAWKRKKAMYQDTRTGETTQCGWVIGFRASDWSHSPVNKWIQQDWVSISECVPVKL